MGNSAPIPDRLIAANRVLVELDAIGECRVIVATGFGDLTVAALTIIAEAQAVLTDLQDQKTDDLTPDQAQSLQHVIDRLRAKLKFFGQSL
jgi:hypothetical protein